MNYLNDAIFYFLYNEILEFVGCFMLPLFLSAYTALNLSDKSDVEDSDMEVSHKPKRSASLKVPNKTNPVVLERSVLLHYHVTFLCLYKFYRKVVIVN